MLRYSIGLALVAVAIFVLVGCGGSTTKTVAAPGSVTDASEAATVADLARQDAGDTEYIAGLGTRVCGKGGAGNPTNYSDCFDENVAPERDARAKAVQEGVRDLVRDVGPQCRRELRGALRTLQGGGINIEPLSGAVRVCKAEASDQNG